MTDYVTTTKVIQKTSTCVIKELQGEPFTKASRSGNKTLSSTPSTESATGAVSPVYSDTDTLNGYCVHS